MQVKQIMTNDPATCTRETTLQEAAKMMVDHDCGCLPVVESEGSGIPVGMITDRDITTRIVAEGKNPLDLTVQDAMTPAAFTVTPETSIEECCNLMEEKQIRRVAVVDGTGACCGMVAQADIALSAGRQQTGEVVQEVSKSTTA
jgi:CBS domain-containing protein